MELAIFGFFGAIILILLIFAETQGKKILGVFAALVMLLLAVFVLTDKLVFQTGTIEEGTCCDTNNQTCSNAGVPCTYSQDCCLMMSCSHKTGACAYNECTGPGLACNSSAECCSGYFCFANATNTSAPNTCETPPHGYHTLTPVLAEPTFAGLPTGITFSTLLALVLGLLSIYGLLHYGLYVGKELNE